MHEIITLQLGQRSNYVATHFWNAQESYFTYSESEQSPVNHDIHFRGGIGADGTETFTPRTLIYDLKGGFGTLRKYNALYQLEQDEPGLDSGLWDTNGVLQQQPKIPQSEYQRCLDMGLPVPQLAAETVRYWSDFNRVFYSPRSIQQINEYDLGSQLMPFETWSTGQTLFSDLDREHDLLDRDFRPFAEECDQLKGIQIFSGVDDAWGGFAASYVDRLKDEYGSKSIWTWALHGSANTQREKRKLASANVARSLSEMGSQVTAFIPMADLPSRLPSYVKPDLRHAWYSSALASLVLESVSLPTRLRGHERLDLWETASRDSRNIYTLESTISTKELPTDKKDEPEASHADDDDTAENRLQENLKQFDVQLSPRGLASTHDCRIFHQISVRRDSTAEPSGSSNYPVQSVNTTTQSFDSQLEYPALDSFPRDLITDQGLPGTTLKVHAALSVSSKVRGYLKELQQSVGIYVPFDQREELSNCLTTLSEAYIDGWESDTDSGDD
ncbi:DML1 [Nannizzia gypsea CBS 118893]|uniref:Protein DML1 n=1 Tax=Arthroderma gypseum (strain ATCC MYA-4604 / CBS 118893) TaxID=535722 RepID=E4V1W4_ARTGP|nr:DML1 [Nannizzia gypsea CBS 118893]EFR04029.1 DML1 [Nannizzia gypsea CBS 118893]